MSDKKIPPHLRFITAVHGGVVDVLCTEELAAGDVVTSNQFRPHTLLQLEFGAVLLDKEGAVLGVLPFTAGQLLGAKARITELEDVRDALADTLTKVDRAISFHKNRAVDWVGKLQARAELKQQDSPDGGRFAISAGPFLRLNSKVSEATSSKRRATKGRNTELEGLRQEVALQELKLKEQSGQSLTVDDVSKVAARSKGRRGGRTTRR